MISLFAKFLNLNFQSKKDYFSERSNHDHRSTRGESQDQAGYWRHPRLRQAVPVPMHLTQGRVQGGQAVEQSDHGRPVHVWGHVLAVRRGIGGYTHQMEDCLKNSIFGFWNGSSAASFSFIFGLFVKFQTPIFFATNKFTIYNQMGHPRPLFHLFSFVSLI